jgi:hypothetical protein
VYLLCELALQGKYTPFFLLKPNLHKRIYATFSSEMGI